MQNVPTKPPLPRSNWAYFLDFDGTLVDIAERPEAVRAGPGLIDLLSDLVVVTGGAVVLVSGRSISALDRFLAPLRLRAAGLHGVEYRLQPEGEVERIADLNGALDRVRPRLADFVVGLEGLQLEDKGASIALHYRRAPHMQENLRAAAMAACEELGPDFTCLAGKMVYEIKPRKANKGQVIERFMPLPPFHGRCPVFLGDDVTDEDGFQACNARGGVSVRVGDGTMETAAQFGLASVDEVMMWLGCVKEEVVG